MRIDRKTQSGAALLTALLMLSLLVVISVEVSDLIRLQTATAQNQQATQTAYWHLKAGEELGIQVIVEQGSEPLSRRAASDDGENAGQLLDFSLDSGRLRVEVRDAQTCFNLNALQSVYIDSTASPESALISRQFLQLLDLLEVESSEARKIWAHTLDWLDSNHQSLLAISEYDGSEKSYYQSLTPPTQPANAGFMNVNEWLLVKGVKAELWETLRPHVCVLGGNASPRWNVNAFNDRTRLVLAALLLQNSEDAVATLIDNRPDGGYTSAEQFQQAAIDETIEVMPDMVAQWQLKSSHFSITSSLSLDTSESKMISLVELSGSQVKIRRRQFEGGL